MSVQESIKFKIIPQCERYYSEDSNWGVYTFHTKDKIPEFLKIVYDNNLFSNYSNEQSQEAIKLSLLAGNMQRLHIGAEYEVTAKLDYNAKYKSYQYIPDIITSTVPKSQTQQKMFLESIVTPNQAIALLDEYPNLVEDVINNADLDINLKNVKGIGKITWDRIKNNIIDNYVISDILVLLQPLGVSYKMIKKLLMYETNPILLKEKLLDDPYIMTEINGLGFKRVDELAIKLNPKIFISKKRLIAYIKYFFKSIGESRGHTWVTLDILENGIRDNVFECMDIYKDFIESEKLKQFFLKIEFNKVGLKQYYETEMDILEILKDLNDTTINKIDLHFEEGIKTAEKELGFELTAEQKSTIESSFKNNVAIITGKAGTGKSTIARAIVKTYIASGLSVSLCALSAKAAQRIAEATGHEASTIHRLLGSDGHKFAYNYNNPLSSDVIIVDESSMINSEIFYYLLSAIKKGSRVVLIGDDKQLPPIGYGNIFSDLLRMKDKFNIIWLTKVLRQAEKSGILSDANKIREGIFPIDNPSQKIVTGELQDMVYMFRTGDDSKDKLNEIAVNAYLKAIEEEGLDNVVIIVPRKKDCLNSSERINQIIQGHLIEDNVPFIKFGTKIFKVGAKVIQRINNYDKNVFNGEIGYIADIWQEIKNDEKVTLFSIKFTNGKELIYARNEIDQIDLAYALTVHLAQGSGFKTVISIIDTSHYIMLDTCLLYTAITRAKERCLLLAEPEAFKKAMSTNNNISRQTWLRSK